jgi:hypothetical protein
MKQTFVTEKAHEDYLRGLIADYDRLRASQWWRFHEEIAQAAERAVKAGAEAPLEFMGMGATGIVLCSGDRAYKVARGLEERTRKIYVRSLADEAEWLATATEISEVRPYVATLIDWNKSLGVITRECPAGRPGGWGASERVRAVFSKVEPYMLAAGWGMPELKEDSVVFTGQRAQIVDAGMATRISNRLASYIESVLEGRRQKEPGDFEETLSDLAFYLRRELNENPKAIAHGKMEPRLDERRARNILEKLYALGARR